MGGLLARRLRESAALRRPLALVGRIDAAVGARLPANITPDAQYRARVLVALVIIFNVAMLAAAPFDAINGAWGAVALQIGWGAICDVLLFQALKRGKIAAMGHFISALLVINLTVIAQEKGGLLTTEIAWQCAAILFSTLALGARGAFVWMVVAILALPIHVRLFDPSQWHGRAMSFKNPVDFGIDIGVLYLATWGLAYAFDRARAKFLSRLEKRNAEMQRVLDHIGDALLTIDRQGRLGTQRSARADALLGQPSTGAFLWDVLGADPANSAQMPWLQMSWDAILEDMLPREVTLAQMPSRVTFHGRTLDLRLTLIEEQSAIRGALVVLHDVTEELARESAERARREILAVFEHVRTDPSAVADFVKEMDRLVASAAEHGTDPAVVMRDIHTIKGNSALFGVESMATLCHQIEERFAQAELYLPSPEDRTLLATRWSALATELREWTGALNAVRVARSELVDLRQAIATGEARDLLMKRVTRWQLTPVERVLSRLARQGEALAKKLEKDVDFLIDADPTLRVDMERLAPVFSSLVHAVRNAIDHGIADAESRVGVGKSPRGAITLRAFATPTDLHLEVADDGEGIAWEVVRQKAESLGLPSSSESDLTNVLLSDGFSTREEATATSGRGVGLAGIRQAAEDLGGAMTIASEAAKGSRFLVRVPLLSRAAAAAKNAHVDLELVVAKNLRVVAA